MVAVLNISRYRLSTAPCLKCSAFTEPYSQPAAAPSAALPSGPRPGPAAGLTARVHAVSPPGAVVAAAAAWPHTWRPAALRAAAPRRAQVSASQMHGSARSMWPVSGLLGRESTRAAWHGGHAVSMRRRSSRPDLYSPHSASKSVGKKMSARPHGTSTVSWSMPLPARCGLWQTGTGAGRVRLQASAVPPRLPPDVLRPGFRLPSHAGAAAASDRQRSWCLGEHTFSATSGAFLPGSRTSGSRSKSAAMRLWLGRTCARPGDTRKAVSHPQQRWARQDLVHARQSCLGPQPSMRVVARGERPGGPPTHRVQQLQERGRCGGQPQHLAAAHGLRVCGGGAARAQRA
jgi:hypothetical protein